jgi:hypothetical protein
MGNDTMAAEGWKLEIIRAMHKNSIQTGAYMLRIINMGDVCDSIRMANREIIS